MYPLLRSDLATMIVRREWPLNLFRLVVPSLTLRTYATENKGNRRQRLGFVLWTSSNGVVSLPSLVTGK